MKTTLGGWALAVSMLLGACDDDGNKQQPDSATSESDSSVADTTSVTPDTTVASETTVPDTTVEPDSEQPDTEQPDVEDDVADTSPPDSTEPEVEDDTTVAPDVEDVAEEVDDDSSEPDTTVADTEEVREETAEEVAVEVEDDAVDEEIIVPAGCDHEPDLPLEFDILTNFSGSEDFTFSGEYAYSVDQNGNLVRDKISGTGNIVLPNLSSFAAGMARLPNGKIAVNDANSNALVIIDITVTPITKTTILTGLSYPNGIDVDPDGFLYVAEQDSGRVRRVDSSNGAFTILAEGLFNPNGVSFGPGYRTLYIGSFGGGTVTALDRNEDGTWSAPYVYLALPGVVTPGTPINICKGNDPGNWCYTENGFGGRCELGPTNKLECIADPQFRDPLEQICVDKDLNDSCSLIIAAKTYTGRCKPVGFGGDLACDIDVPPSQPCFHQPAGNTCVSFEFGQPTYGVCVDHGPQGLLCDPPDTSGFGGGLDGLNVDECGTVYTTEYIAGIVWRKRPNGPVEQATQLPSQWIPNMHWGNGIGGWDPTTLYVADRDEGRMFGLKIGRHGKQETVQWP